MTDRAIEADTSCGTCDYSNAAFVGGDPVLECRRFPPQVFFDAVNGDAVQAFPNVHVEDWCGEHRPRISP